MNSEREVRTMTTRLRFYRESPIKRPGQVEKVLIRFGIGPERGMFADGNAWLDQMSADDKRKFQQQCDNALPTGFIETAEQAKAGGMKRDITEWPADYISTVSVEQCDDGSGIELEISLDNESLAPALIAELRACGFVGGRSPERMTHDQS
jgi:hypothetical protein